MRPVASYVARRLRLSGNLWPQAGREANMIAKGPVPTPLLRFSKSRLNSSRQAGRLDTHAGSPVPALLPLFSKQVYRASRLNQAAVQWRSGSGHPGVPVAQVPWRRQCWQVTLKASPEKTPASVTERVLGGSVAKHVGGVTESAI